VARWRLGVVGSVGKDASSRHIRMLLPGPWSGGCVDGAEWTMSAFTVGAAALSLWGFVPEPAQAGEAVDS